jgi:hypothetical protein
LDGIYKDIILFQDRDNDKEVRINSMGSIVALRGAFYLPKARYVVNEFGGTLNMQATHSSSAPSKWAAIPACASTSTVTATWAVHRSNWWNETSVSLKAPPSTQVAGNLASARLVTAPASARCLQYNSFSRVFHSFGIIISCAKNCQSCFIGVFEEPRR